MVPGSTLIYGSNFWSTTLYPRLLSSIPSAAALVPLPMDDTTPPVTKIYLVSLIYTPKKENKRNTPTFTINWKREENPAAVRGGIIASRKPLLRHTCMDLYHTTSGARMKPEITQHYSTVAILCSKGASHRGTAGSGRSLAVWPWEVGIPTASRPPPGKEPSLDWPSAGRRTH